MGRRKGTMDMTTGSLWGKIIAYTVPVILTSLLQLLFNAADLVVVGRFCGSISLAAVGATGALTALIVNFFIGLSIGAGVGVARGIGARRDPQVQNIVHTAVLTAIVSGIILTVVGIAFAPFFLRLMGTPPDVLALSSSYMRFFFSGMTFMMIFNFGASILRAVGDTSSPLVYLTIAGLFNVILNLIFVTRFDMGVDGVGLATTLSQAVASGLVIRELTLRTDACRFMPSRMKFHPEALRQIFIIGMPAGIQSSLFAVSNVVIQSSVNSFGYIAMTGNAAAANIESFEYVCMNSFQQTSMNFTGQNAGAGNYRRVKSINRICLLYVTLVGLCMSALLYGFGRPLLGIYIQDSAEAIECGITRMSFVCLPYFLCGIMDTVTGSLRGMGYSTLPMLTAILGVVVMRIGWILTVFRIPEFHTLSGLYVSYPVSWIITFAAQAVMFSVILRKILRENPPHLADDSPDE